MDRRQGSDRQQSGCRDENSDQVNDVVLSQEDQPRTHSTVREILRATSIPKSSVVHDIKKDLQLKSFKRQRTCTVADCPLILLKETTMHSKNLL